MRARRIPALAARPSWSWRTQIRCGRGVRQTRVVRLEEIDVTQWSWFPLSGSIQSSGKRIEDDPLRDEGPWKPSIEVEPPRKSVDTLRGPGEIGEGLRDQVDLLKVAYRVMHRPPVVRHADGVLDGAGQRR